MWYLKICGFNIHTPVSALRIAVQPKILIEINLLYYIIIN